MAGVYLQRMLDNLPQGSLPPNWRAFDLASFSKDKTLWDYQQLALDYALKALWCFYRAPDLSVKERKQALYQWYRDFGQDEDLDIPIDKSSGAKRQVAALQETYYESVEDRLPYWQFINSICFWMATGSGKSLVIVKLVEILHELIKRGEIPNNDILILAHRDDLLEQLQAHIQEFNTTGPFFIRVQELRDYSEVKRAQPNLFSENERTIFYYRSDNLSDEQKEKIVDFRNYDNGGRWYIFLDEAHKGDREDSKRQQIYAILSRNGFMFNFSATFTDPREIITTAYNFNLSEFIRKGYGKHIYIFEQETRAFSKKEDFTESEKQKIVLKTLILLAYIQTKASCVRTVDQALYHHPLLMALVNSVNTKDADLKLLFRELVRIANGGIDEGQWEAAKAELIEEIREAPPYIYEPGTRVRLDVEGLQALSQKVLLKKVFNAPHPGQIEVLVRPSNRKEVAFKLKTSDEPFALIRIGDVSGWLTEELQGFEVNHRLGDEGFFERLNEENSSINLLLGSRSFYEGWDSNRPNVILYINIGKGMDAKKFILQSVGRGARIEPLSGYRKRFSMLKASGVLSEGEDEIFNEVKKELLPIESEFIFGTNRKALETVVQELDQEENQAGSYEVSLQRNDAQIGDHLLLIPVFKQQDKLLYHHREIAKFSLSPDNLEQLETYLDYIDDDRVLLALYDINPKQISNLRASVVDSGRHFRTDGPQYKNIPVLIQQVNQFLSLYSQKFEKFKPLEDEITHYDHVRVFLPQVKFEEFQKHLSEFYKHPNKIAEFRAKYEAQQITLDEMLEKVSNLQPEEGFSYQGKMVQFKRIQKHYYLPLLVSEDARLDYLRSVIQVPSEVRFLSKLEKLLEKDDHPFNGFDWWLFSRIDENYDHINIPYYYPVDNRMANFRPDFIFWMQKGDDYQIAFVDPKGTSRTEYQYKVDGFRELFEQDEEPITFEYEGLKVKVRLFLFTDDRAWTADYYRRYWLDEVEDIVCLSG
jgi:type III restriction enzyme